MPRALVLVLAFFGLSGLLDLVAAVMTDSTGTTTWVRLGLTGLLIVGLLLGKEIARTAGLVVAALGILASAWSGLQVGRLFTTASAQGLDLGAVPVVLAVVTVLHLIAFSVIMLCLRRDDVQAWMFARANRA